MYLYVKMTKSLNCYRWFIIWLALSTCVYLVLIYSLGDLPSWTKIMNGATKDYSSQLEILHLEFSTHLVNLIQLMVIAHVAMSLFVHGQLLTSYWLLLQLITVPVNFIVATFHFFDTKDGRQGIIPFWYLGAARYAMFKLTLVVVYLVLIICTLHYQSLVRRSLSIRRFR